MADREIQFRQGMNYFSAEWFAMMLDALSAENFANIYLEDADAAHTTLRIYLPDTRVKQMKMVFSQEERISVEAGRHTLLKDRRLSVNLAMDSKTYRAVFYRTLLDDGTAVFETCNMDAALSDWFGQMFLRMEAVACALSNNVLEQMLGFNYQTPKI